MGDLKSRRLIIAKVFLFLTLGLLASAMLLAQTRNLQVAALLAIAIWAFCRFYYFAFYVIEHYVDSGYRYSGLSSFAFFMIRRRSQNISREDLP